jgi:hydrogenase maturation protein HypF
MEHTSKIEQASIKAMGVVQGVGFRPFVYGLAMKYGLSGWVCNSSEGVIIEVEGTRISLDGFIADLEIRAPALAHIEKIDAIFNSPVGYSGFEIRPSIVQPGKYQPVSPDIATCSLCLEDIISSGNRRFRYAFTNCTNCGPRFTIIRDTPYDRQLTTMSDFKMCPECRREYEDPLDRRFHAQPNACPVCGPQLRLTDNLGKEIACDDVIIKAAALLKEGEILAIKGLGGFLLACSAENSTSVRELRRRKLRPSKPFAIMLKDVKEAKHHCIVTLEEAGLLKSSESPIVLLPWKAESSICVEVASGLKCLGVMLPYTPLHHLLMREVGIPLVMTSGNLSEEPIASDNTEAIDRLGGIADYFILHNRDIYSTYDDSIIRVIDEQPEILRRARGYAPYPIHLLHSFPPVLACGADEKNTFCLTRDSYAFVSQHIGDMENYQTIIHYEETIELYKRLFHTQPECIAYDMHPEYLSTKYALEQAAKAGIRAVPVQHHHAHIASCLADNIVEEQVIGVAFDGTGYGTDGKIWGGEFLVADYKGFKRAAHLEYLPLPGGSASIKNPYRLAIGYILSLLGKDAFSRSLLFLQKVDDSELELIVKQVESGFNTPLNSSMGRLFDAVSALSGIRGTIDYEAQAAIEMEMKSYESELEQGSYSYSLANENGCLQIKVRDLFSEIIDELSAHRPQAEVGVKFHNTVAEMTAEVCRQVRETSGLNTVALSGGCFQNRLLTLKVDNRLKTSGFKVLRHRNVPCNDGGISLGQAVIAGVVE